MRNIQRQGILNAHRLPTQLQAGWIHCLSHQGTVAHTLASGLRVPKPYGDYLILDILRKSAGIALTVTDAEIMDAFRQWARREGIFAAPEGAASLAAYRKLRATGFFSADDKVVLFNTGSGLKYLEVIDSQKSVKAPASRQIGGIIGPY